jgi:2-oxoglutarate dehydrogenase E1 component
MHLSNAEEREWLMHSYEKMSAE